MENKKVAVVTPSLSRKSLRNTLQSVRNQTYKNIQHYVILDGINDEILIEQLEQEFPEVIFIKLPCRIGSKVLVNGPALSLGFYYVEEDYICILDDDNWILPNHIEELIKCFSIKNVSFAYCLRYLYKDDTNFICKDNYSSLGFFTRQIVIKINDIIFTQYANKFSDTNCIMFTKEILFKYGNIWNSNFSNDKMFFRSLLQNNEIGVHNAKFTSCYLTDLSLNLVGNYSEEDKKDRAINLILALYEENKKFFFTNKINIPQIIINNKLILLETYFKENLDDKEKYENFMF